MSCPVKAHTLAHMNLSSSVIFDRVLVARLYVYLDGGFKESDDPHAHSTWGVCVGAEYHDGTQVVCLPVGGSLSLLCDGPSYCGQVLPGNSFEAEVHANTLEGLVVRSACWNPW